MAQTSIARKIKYGHVAKDGRTPVYNATTDKWDYVVNATEAQMVSSGARLKDINDNSANAISKANKAKEVADTKATKDEAVTEVKTQMFEVYDSNGTRLVADSFRIEQGEAGWSMMFCAHKALVAPGSSPAPFCLRLGYASDYELKMLEERIAAIEKKLGIS